jgi:hypothetical protein
MKYWAFAISMLISVPCFAGTDAIKMRNDILDDAAQQKFAGLSFGAGLSMTFDNVNRIESATVVNGIVRVDNEKNAVARVLLESHYFFLPDCKFLGVEITKWGWGPFVGVQPGSGEIVEAAGLGVLLGFRRPNGSGDSFNIGVGYMVDPSVRVLGDGIVANQPLPQGETAVRYKEKSRGGLLVVVSFAF